MHLPEDTAEREQTDLLILVSMHCTAYLAVLLGRKEPSRLQYLVVVLDQHATCALHAVGSKMQSFSPKLHCLSLQ